MTNNTTLSNYFSHVQTLIAIGVLDTEDATELHCHVLDFAMNYLSVIHDKATMLGESNMNDIDRIFRWHLSPLMQRLIKLDNLLDVVSLWPSFSTAVSLSSSPSILEDFVDLFDTAQMMVEMNDPYGFYASSLVLRLAEAFIEMFCTVNEEKMHMVLEQLSNYLYNVR